MRAPLVRGLVGALLVGGAGLGIGVGAEVAVGPAPAYAADNVCEGVDASTARSDTTISSLPYSVLGNGLALDALARSAPRSSRPVRVAVLSSGVASLRSIPVHTAVDATGVGGDVVDPLGTEVAGLVAGRLTDAGAPVGFAPHAEVVDVRVYVAAGSDDPRERPSAANLADGLTWVAERARELHVEVAVVPFVLGPSPVLRAAVRQVREAGVVLVAASGDRPEAGSPFASQFADPPARDEDAGPLFFPAGYPGVIAVGSNAVGDPSGTLANVVMNSRTTVAAPSYNAVSYGLNGSTCLVQPTSTAAAAGEVAGVVALIRMRYPKDTPAQTVARLVDTADGTTDDPTPLVGAGIVQPYEALTRPLAPARDGTVERAVVRAERTQRATAPEPESDLLATTRGRALWWGLVGGGALAVALMLRPVLARRRR